MPEFTLNIKIYPKVRYRLEFKIYVLPSGSLSFARPWFTHKSFACPWKILRALPLLHSVIQNLIHQNANWFVLTNTLDNNFTLLATDGCREKNSPKFCPPKNLRNPFQGVLKRWLMHLSFSLHSKTDTRYSTCLRASRRRASPHRKLKMQIRDARLRLRTSPRISESLWSSFIIHFCSSDRCSFGDYQSDNRSPLFRTNWRLFVVKLSSGCVRHTKTQNLYAFLGTRSLLTRAVVGSFVRARSNQCVWLRK